MSCDKEPHQAPRGEFARYIKAIRESGVCVAVRRGSYHPLIKTLRMWVDVHGMPSCTVCTKRVLRGLTMPEKAPMWVELQWGPTTAANLLLAFGAATQGHEVGHIGRDMLTPLLGDSRAFFRKAAIEVLAGWADDEEMFVSMLRRHLEREEDPELRAFCQEQLDWLEGRGEDGKDDELRDEESDTSGSPELDSRDRELEPYFEARRGLENSLRAIVRHPELPGFLERAIQLHPDITLGMIESSQVGHPCVRQSTLKVHIEREIVRVWSSELAVSIEPTANDDTWLVFARW